MILGPGFRTRLAALTVGLLGFGAAVPAAAGTIVLQNDSVVDFGTAIIQAGFVAGEHGASWLTSTCDGELVAVRILWLSLLGGAPNTLGEAVRISEAGAFPSPGTQLRELLGPLMQDGGFNEFTLTPAIPVSNGQTIVVSFIFLETPPALGPSLVTDSDGCQAGRNAIFASPPNAWFSACLLGVSGDFAIRAVVDCSAAGIFSDGFESGDTSAWSVTVP